MIGNCILCCHLQGRQRPQMVSGQVVHADRAYCVPDGETYPSSFSKAAKAGDLSCKSTMRKQRMELMSRSDIENACNAENLSL
jgi:hypothetical protein